MEVEGGVYEDMTSEKKKDEEPGLRSSLTLDNIKDVLSPIKDGADAVTQSVKQQSRMMKNKTIELGENVIEMGKRAGYQTKELVVNLKDKSMLLMDDEE